MKTNIEYIASEYKEEYRLFLDKEYYNPSHQLCVERVQRGIVLPFRSVTGLHGNGGVCNDKGDYIDISATPQENLMVGGYDYQFTSIRYVDEEVVWGGYFIHQWGHFLVDVLPRLWWTIKNPSDKKLVFTTANASKNIDGNFWEVLRMLGLKEEQIEIVEEITQYREIIIPELSLQRPYFFTKEYREIIEVIRKQADDSMKRFDKVYFTRTKMRKAKNTELNEKNLVRLYKANGYAILAPEKLTFRQQLSIFANCRKIVALSGTIPHNIIFAREDADWVIINKTVRINVTQFILNEVSSVNTKYVDAYLQLFPVSPGAGPFWIDVTSEMERYAQDEQLFIPKIVKSSRKGILFRTYDFCKYCILYFRLRDPSLDIGGKIIVSSRPLEDKYPIHDLYFENRNKLGDIFDSLDPIKLIAKRIKSIFR